MKEQTFLAAASRKKEYDAPMVELIEARVEQGFQLSGGTVGPVLTEEDPINGDALFS